ncbi:trypsin-like serine protease [Mesorhizobium sp. CA7]|uniref:trypsin-like serine protease n=1 Tax=Mesorhizobium sp. CA7 TaxID=588501 RepID=UPI001CCA183D|nr:trypsin-like serine protease [Mesorhizobium sp. CA7]MBZ9815734.1 S1 family peptidase [Mesorhizobium sp. CA7]
MQRFRLLCILAAFLIGVTPAWAGPMDGGRWPDGSKLPEESTGQEIWNGTPSSNQLIVGLYYKDRAGVPRICSGLIVAGDFILTAAHCTCQQETRFLVTRSDHLDNAFWKSANLVSRFSDNICAGLSASGDDLALLRLTSPFVIEPGDPTCTTFDLIGNIRYAAAWYDSVPPSFRAGGFGLNGDFQNSQGVRREASISTLSFYCASKVFQSAGCRRFKEFVLGNTATQTRPFLACGGDSGGPVYRVEGSHFVPVGVVSRSVVVGSRVFTAAACGTAGVFTHLGRTEVIDWLRQFIKAGGRDCGVVK